MVARRAARFGWLMCALLLAPRLTLAISLGEAEVHSFIGSPLHLEIPVHGRAEDMLDTQCLTIVPLPAGVADPSQALGLRLQLSATEPRRLIVESRRPVTEPYAKVRIRLDCGGAGLVRDYAVLVDPPPEGLPATTPAGSPAAPAAIAWQTSPPEASALTAARVDSSAAPGRATDPTADQPPPARRHRSVHPTHPRLRLEGGLLALRRLTGSAAGSGADMPVLRLDRSLSVAAPETPALLAQRANLRALREQVMSGDDTLERMLLLQGQVRDLAAQLRSLQGAATAAPASAGATPPAVQMPSAAAPLPAASPAPVAPAHPQPVAPVHPKPVAPEADQDSDWSVLIIAAGFAVLALAALLYVRRRKRSGRMMEDMALDADEPAFDAESPAPAAPLPRRRPLELPSGGAPRAPPPEPAERAAPAQADETPDGARAAYLAERFPEIAAGLITLSDADSVATLRRLIAFCSPCMIRPRGDV